jgi:CHASE3 domain sensor protein
VSVVGCSDRIGFISGYDRKFVTTGVKKWSELLDLRVHRVVTAQLYENGDTTDDENLLARMNARMKEHKEDILARIEADRKADQEIAEANQAVAEDDRKELKEMMKATKEDIKSSQAEMKFTVCANRSDLKETIQHEIRAVVQPIRSELDETIRREIRVVVQPIRSDLKEAIQQEIRAVVQPIQSDLKEAIQQEIRAVVRPIRSELDETSACNEATETEPDPGTMQSVEDHQEIHMEEAAVLPVGELRKQRKYRNLAAGRRQKPK